MARYMSAYPAGTGTGDCDSSIVLHAGDVRAVAYELQCANISNLICVVAVPHTGSNA